MGLFHNLSMSVLHLVFIVMDVLVLALLLKLICTRWELPVVKQLSEILEPFLRAVLSVFRRLISRCCSRHFSEMALLKLLLVSLWIMRLMIIAVVS